MNPHPKSYVTVASICMSNTLDITRVQVVQHAYSLVNAIDMPNKLRMKIPMNVIPISLVKNMTYDCLRLSF